MYNTMDKNAVVETLEPQTHCKLQVQCAEYKNTATTKHT